jgi:hypothetical protein
LKYSSEFARAVFMHAYQAIRLGDWPDSKLRMRCTMAVNADHSDSSPSMAEGFISISIQLPLFP